MSLVEEFKNKANNWQKRLIETNELTGLWSKQIINILDKLNEEQIEIISTHASAGVFHQPIGLNQTKSERIYHALKDPVQKSKFLLMTATNEREFLQAALITQNALESIVHNIPKLMAPNMPKTLNLIIDSYEDIKNEITNAIEELEKHVDNKDEIIAQTQYHLNQGMEYIAPLPDDYPQA